MDISDCWPRAYKLIVNGDTGRAIELCEKEPCSESLECQRFLGWKYYERDNMEKALSWFFRAAEQGDAEALYGIGSVHFVQRAFPAALQYYERAADKGYSRSYHWIGYMYHQGLGMPRNINMAIDYYKKSAAHGYLVAERALIHLAWQEGGILRRILALPKYIYIVLKAATIAYCDINDYRIVDVPNAFVKKMGSRSEVSPRIKPPV